MSHSKRQKLRNRKRRIAYRLRDMDGSPQDEPMLRAGNIHYDLSGRARGLGSGGIGMIHLLARRTGLIEAIDERLKVLKVHLPYHESDHVLNIAYNLLCSGTCLEDLELRRNDEVYLDALGAQLGTIANLSGSTPLPMRFCRYPGEGTAMRCALLWMKFCTEEMTLTALPSPIIPDATTASGQMSCTSHRNGARFANARKQAARPVVGGGRNTYMQSTGFESHEPIPATESMNEE